MNHRLAMDNIDSEHRGCYAINPHTIDMQFAKHHKHQNSIDNQQRTTIWKRDIEHKIMQICSIREIQDRKGKYIYCNKYPY